MISFRLSLIALLTAATLTGCSRDLSSDVYTSDSNFNLTLKGQIISARSIVIKETDKLEQNTTGMISGAATGGVAGANVGSGHGSTATTIGGVILGGIIGAAIEGTMGEQEGMEYIVKVDTKSINPENYEGGEAMRKAISSLSSNGLVTIVQGVDEVYKKGQKVYIIFSDKRVRITPIG